MVRASGKCSSRIFIDVDISNLMAPLRMLYVVILKIMFNIWKTVRASVKCSELILCRLIFAIKQCVSRFSTT